MSRIGKEVKGYKIDFVNNKFVMNYKFAKAARVYGSSEYNIYRDIISDFPNMEVIIKSGREQKTPRYNKRLTYENMEKYISTFENAAELLELFELVKRKSAPLKSPYKYVSDWFHAQFPDYDISTKDVKNIVVIPIGEPEISKYEEKAKKEAI